MVDIDSVIQGETVDFIHDIRSDFFDEDQYKLAVNTEIDELNEIFHVTYDDASLLTGSVPGSDVIKINMNSLNRYLLPANGRMFYQPFCKHRGMN